MQQIRTTAETILQSHIQNWGLICDCDRFYTHSSLLQAVIYQNNKAILKIPFSEEEKRGNKLMVWWNGLGAANVFKWDNDAILLERISSEHSLKSMVVNNNDDEATQIICELADILHSHTDKQLPELVALNVWFEDLFTYAGKYGGIFIESAKIASDLLKKQENITVLHVDLHHDNILYSPERGWLAIDPKGLIGERTFDYVNILCNPDKETALAQDRLTKQVQIISKHTGIEVNHLLKWTIAWAGLSAI